MKTAEILHELEGREVLSIELEGCVGVFGGKVYRHGEELRLTDEQIQTLWREHIGQEIENDLNALFSELNASNGLAP